MKKRFHLKKYLITFFVFSVFLLSLASYAFGTDKSKEDPFLVLQNKLIKEGFKKSHISKLYHRPEVYFDIQSVSLFFTHSESRLNYAQFTKGKNIDKARKYMQKYNKELKEAESIHGTDREIITAIILIETKLGTYLGKSYIMNTLSTMAVASDPELREKIWKEIPPSRRIPRDVFEKRADIKSKWAYKELKALLKYSLMEGIDPVDIRGSYAGAMGISQFMPSNVITLAKDGDKDGHINLFTHADAIMSIANYLRHYGWHSEIDNKKAYKVLLRYNYSKYYANTVLEIARLLKG